MSPIIGIVVGLVMQAFGGILGNVWLIGTLGWPLFAIGWLIFVGSCCGLAKSKGYTPLLGLIGIPFHLIGPIILFFLPDNNKGLSRR